MENLIPNFIIKKFEQKNYSGEFAAITMFLDISGFTVMTQTLMKNGKEGAEILSEIINKVFTPAIDAIYKNGGFISIFAGDAFTSIFPAEKTSILNAFLSAIEINKTFNEIGLQKTKFGDFQLSVKIGLSAGKVEWKIIPDKKQNSYYFRGEAINNCAYSEHNCQQSEIIFDQAILDKVENKNEIEFTKKPKNYYLLEKINKTIPAISTNSADSLNSIVEKFIPKSIFNLKTKGEFRDIISCFISFTESPNFEKHLSIVIELASQFGGYFNKVDFGDKGGVILVLFGAPSGKEKLYHRACDFALSVRELTLKGFTARIGLTFGTVFAGFVGSELRSEYTALGMVVNLSARYMMKAEWNEIFIDRHIYSFTKDNYRIDYLSDFELKGFKHKIPVYRLIQKNEIIQRSFYEGSLIGREKELQKLKEFTQPIYKGKFGGIVYVHGIAGIGKSRLVNELKETENRKKEIGLNWFYLPCDEILQKSFNPVEYFLKQYFEQSEENSLKGNKSNFENRLDNLIEKTKNNEIKKELLRTKSILGAMINLYWENSLYEQLDAKGRYENTLYAVKNLIKAESLQKPVIIELEDGHWIDSDSKKLLEVLTTNIDNYSIIFIAACRLKDDSSLFSFDLPDVLQKKIILEYLDKETTRELINSKFGGEASAPLFHLIWQKSEGNPFYIEQIILYLHENHFINDKLDITHAEIEIPKTINSIIIARIDRLTMNLKEIVQTASVIGREFTINVLSAMLNKKEITFQITEGEKENIWNKVTELQYIFKHALIRESVYEMQLKKRLRSLHKLAAEVIEEFYKDDIKEYYADLSNHYEKAEIFTKAIEFLEKAGDFAKENYKNENAIEFYDRLLRNLANVSEPPQDLKIDTLLKKGVVFQLIGKWSEAEEIFKTTLLLSEEFFDKKRIAKSTGFLGVQYFLKGEYENAMECYKKELKIWIEVGDKTKIASTSGNMGNVYQHQSNYPKAIEYHKKQLNICEELGDKNGISQAFANLGNVYSNKAKYPLSIKYYESALKISEELVDKSRIAGIIGNMGIVYMNQGKYDKAIECQNENIKICEELGDRRGISTAVMNLGVVNYSIGNDKNAIECYEKSLKICEELGYKRGISGAVGNIGVIYMKQGNDEKALEYYERQLKISNELNDKRVFSYAVGNMGIIYFNQGNHSKSLECFEKFLTISKVLGNKREISFAYGNIGSLYEYQGNYKKAKELFEKQLKISEELNDKSGISLAADNIGALYFKQSKYAEALKYFEVAIKIDYELNVKSNLLLHLSDKSNCYYKMQKFEEAKKCNEECYKIAKELESKEHIFFCDIMKAKIEFKAIKNNVLRFKNCIEPLEKMLEENEDKEQIATLNFELTFIYLELENTEVAEEHKKKAILFYKDLYQKTPNIEYKNKIEELEKL
ncbi:MAG: tetratricopeptide repeat protein [Candidatus Atribacteria bacterium]|nr:tetratricopeptide repeat protein [Candidatus Atribacteria bacterium]